jgi:hypothetical protein
MLSILFTKATVVYYLLALVCEYLTRRGIYEANFLDNKSLLNLAKSLSIVLITFNICYSMSTNWMACIGLLCMNMIIFLVSENLCKPALKELAAFFVSGKEKSVFSVITIFKI